jgi:uncharacterized membrane protein YbaN (DUF454 family)
MQKVLWVAAAILCLTVGTFAIVIPFLPSIPILLCSLLCMHRAFPRNKTINRIDADVHSLEDRIEHK